MSLIDHKITAEDRKRGVKSAPDMLTGTASENKNIFDRFADFFADSYNAALDFLMTQEGAGAIGAAVAGVAGENTAAILTALKAMLDDRYTKGEIDETFYDKKIVDALLRQSIEGGGSAGSLIQDIVVDGQRLIIKRYDGTQIEVDMAKVNRNSTHTATLTAAGWLGGQPPFTQVLRVDGIPADANGVLGLAPEATKQQRDACVYAQLVPTAQALGSITVSALIERPEIDLPVLITILG